MKSIVQNIYYNVNIIIKSFTEFDNLLINAIFVFIFLLLLWLSKNVIEILKNSIFIHSVLFVGFFKIKS